MFLKNSTHDLLIEEINKITPSEIISNNHIGNEVIDSMIYLSNVLSLDDYKQIVLKHFKVLSLYSLGLKEN